MGVDARAGRVGIFGLVERALSGSDGETRAVLVLSDQLPIVGVGVCDWGFAVC